MGSSEGRYFKAAGSKDGTTKQNGVRLRVVPLASTSLRRHGGIYPALTAMILGARDLGRRA
jgi:hypothetical protein